ncbi:MAG: hypothetical protein IPP32_14160 [Bacteroidetes bacterium]|nr:hypothetical protein [Bacteroidota bacterium]
MSAQIDSSAKFKKYFWGQAGVSYSLSNNGSDVWGVNGGLASNFAKNSFLYFTANYQVRLRNSIHFMDYDMSPNCVTSRNNFSLCYGRGVKISTKSFLIIQTGILVGSESYRGKLEGVNDKGWFMQEPIFEHKKVSYVGIPLKLSFHFAILHSFGVTINLYDNLLSPYGDYGISINTCFGKLRKKQPRNNSLYR